ncbi:hypothetical protein FZEAL_6303 [Fusarium zealandicum]|uniref:Uncharacterized protein n=1 Tax=Fusarium zealandicum TaxID=1053134 RepID=A0A8H4XK04_9HYPO|nr:hypothetical protein FZEAL_6303 [Fusarium zealandicum]
MCWEPQAIFDICGHRARLPHGEISAENREWLFRDGDALVRRCPRAVRTDTVCLDEAVEAYPMLSVNRNVKCDGCKDGFWKTVKTKIMAVVWFRTGWE